MERILAILIIFCILLSFDTDVKKRSLGAFSSSESFGNFFWRDEALVPIKKETPILKIRKVSLLNENEIKYYRRNTWDPSKTLEQNRRKLTEDFMKTCVDAVEDFSSGPRGVCLKIKGQFSGIFLSKSAQIERFDESEISNMIYLTTASPSFCRLIRALLTKYKTMPHRPQRALFLFTKGEANHSSYDGLRYVLNVRKMDHTILSALDCSKRKMLFGEIVFHEMLHWYHRVSDPVGYEKRGKSTDCICRRFQDRRDYFAFGNEGEAAVKYFSNDEEYYTMYGLKEEDGDLILDDLCEATYTYEQHQYVRGSHVWFGRRFPEERNFIVNFRDSSLLKFFQNNPPPEFGRGEFGCSDL
jgi:hypothetical protein